MQLRHTFFTLAISKLIISISITVLQFRHSNKTINQSKKLNRCQSVFVSLSLCPASFLTAVSGDLPPYKYRTDSNNPTVCLRFPQYVIRFTELWMAQCQRFRKEADPTPFRELIMCAGDLKWRPKTTRRDRLGALRSCLVPNAKQVAAASRSYVKCMRQFIV